MWLLTKDGQKWYIHVDTWVFVHVVAEYPLTSFCGITPANVEFTKI